MANLTQSELFYIQHNDVKPKMCNSCFQNKVKCMVII